MRITKLIGGVIRNKNRILRILNERITGVVGVGDLLNLLILSVERIDGYNTIRLIREEAGSVVDVNDRTAAEYLGVLCGINSYLLILPMIQIFRSSMTPMLVASYGVGRIVYFESELAFRFGIGLTLIVEMICAIAISMATVGIVHKLLRR